MSASSSISGRSPSRPPASSSASTPSISPTCRSQRIIRSRCSTQYAHNGKLRRAEGRTSMAQSFDVTYLSGSKRSPHKRPDAGACRTLRAACGRATITRSPRTSPATRPTPSSSTELRLKVRDAHRVATTVGFGPRFLHSTGQLHKGGPDTCVVLQITADDPDDPVIPGMNVGFRTLLAAQALGRLDVAGQTQSPRGTHPS